MWGGEGQWLMLFPHPPEEVPERKTVSKKSKILEEISTSSNFIRVWHYFKASKMFSGDRKYVARIVLLYFLYDIQIIW